MTAYPEEQVIFQQEASPKHTAKIVKEWQISSNGLARTKPRPQLIREYVGNSKKAAGKISKCSGQHGRATATEQH